MPAPQRVRRPLFHFFAYGIIAITALLTLLPQIASQGLIYGLGRYGAGAVSVDNIDINLFTGRLAVDELQIYQSAAQVLRIGHAEVEIDWHTLWNKRIQLRAVNVDNLSVTVEQSTRGTLRIAGFDLPAAETASPAGSSPLPAQPWGFGIGAVALHNNAVHLIRPGYAFSLGIDRLETGPLHSWEPSSATPYSIQLRFNHSQLLLDGKASPFADAPTADTRLKLSALRLADFQPLFPAALGKLEGELSATMDIHIQQEGQQLLLKQDGALQLDQFSMTRDRQRIDNRKLHWQGKTRLTAEPDALHSMMEGTLSAQGLRFALSDQHIVLDSGDINWTGSVEAGESADTVKLNGQLGIGDISLAAEAAEKPHATLSRIELEQVSLKGLNDIHIGAIALSGLQTSLKLTKTGLVPLQSHRNAAQRNAGNTDAATEAAADTPRIRIDAVRLDGNNRIHFEDATIHPAFRQDILPEQFTLGTIDSATPEQGAAFALKAKLGEHATLSAQGDTYPFLPQPGASFNVKLREFEMPPLSPYLVRQLGYRINSGQLDSNLQLKIADGAMQGEVRIMARQLDMEQEDPARIAEFEQKSTMPISTALGLLRDDDGNIDIKVPLSGKLDDPKFDISDAINTALANTMRTAAVSYLKYLLQPYSSVVTLVNLAGKAGGGVQLEPVVFSAGTAEPDDKMRGYIEKLSTLLAKKENLQLRLCGIATTADLAVISKGKLKEIPPEGNEALETLAHQRAETIKRILVENYGLKPAKLFICHPTLERDAEAVPRVQLQF